MSSTRAFEVKELRKLRNVDEGLSTMEVEIEATGSLLNYMTAGTLALLPRNDPRLGELMRRGAPVEDRCCGDAETLGPYRG